jgi:Eco57I restriction-modification methylase
MLAGFGGHLIAEAFLEQRLLRDNAGASEAVVRSCRVAVGAVGPASSARGLLDAAAAPLLSALGFAKPVDVSAGADGTLAAAIQTVDAGTACAALLVTPFAARLDGFWRRAVTEALRRRTQWCVLFNGTHIRVVDAARLYARRFVEFDLALAACEPATCRALLAVVVPASIAAGDADPRSLHTLVLESDRHEAAVCRSLRTGVLTASADLIRAMTPNHRSRRRQLDAAFEQALTVVYRILFLLFAEARALVPLWHPVYRDSYSIESLREASERTPDARGLWDGLRAIARLAHAGCRAGDLRVTPFNGRLFSPAQTPLADRGDLDDRAARRAVLALSTRPAPSRTGLERIAYRDLGVEQLGAVYETVLDYEPRVDSGNGVTLAAGSGLRKSTGTFYTPQPIAEYLVRRTLGPLVNGASAERILRLRILDPAMGSGAFLVAACRYLAAAYERALADEGAGDLDEADRAAIRRMIAERCLYGVDLNPMAVQLARLSLWLATLAAERPLGFLDHHLRIGDSLAGAWLADLRRPPHDVRRRRPTSLPLFDDDAQEAALRDAVPMRFSLDTMPTDTVEQVREKERAFEAASAREGIAAWRRIADLWCASWFAESDHSIPPAAFPSLCDAILTGRGPLPRATAERGLAAAAGIAAARRFFHWELEFPEVFFDPSGARAIDAGFDAIVGNPPWDMIRADAGPAEARTEARHAAEQLVRFTRHSGVYTAQSDGHANRYQLFAERAVALAPRAGRIGLVLPSGLATDHGSARLRRHLLTACDVDTMVGVDNRRGIFPIHRSVRFLLVTASRGGPTRSLACRLGLDDPSELERLGDEPAAAGMSFPVRLSVGALERLSGPDLAIPMVATNRDLAIVERAAALFPALASDDGWRARFGRELNASDDRAAFRPAGYGLPLVEGKHLEPFRAAVGMAARSVGGADAARLLRSGAYRHPRLAYRDVAGAANRLTLIAAVLPMDCVSLHTVFCLRTPLPPRAQHFLCGLFNSLIVNYFVRLRVSTHVTTAIVERLPIPTAAMARAAFRDIAALARLLARKDDLAAFARLNRSVAGLYQLSADEYRHVLDTFPLIEAEVRSSLMNEFLRNVRML